MNSLSCCEKFKVHLFIIEEFFTTKNYDIFTFYTLNKPEKYLNIFGITKVFVNMIIASLLYKGNIHNYIKCFIQK